MSNPQQSSAAPRIQAPAALRAFRQESQLSWPSFNHLWMDISNILNSPSYDILLTPQRSHEPLYAERLADLTRDILASDVFGPGTHGRWNYGRHQEEEDLNAITDFIARLTAHAASGIMNQVMAWDDPCDVRADKVGAWLMNEEATMWDEYEFFNRAEDGQQVSKGDYDYDEGTAVAPSRAITASKAITASGAITASVSMVPETVYTEKGVDI